jgi:hypothetical protein
MKMGHSPIHPSTEPRTTESGPSRYPPLPHGRGSVSKCFLSNRECKERSSVEPAMCLFSTKNAFSLRTAHQWEARNDRSFHSRFCAGDVRDNCSPAVRYSVVAYAYPEMALASLSQSDRFAPAKWFIFSGAMQKVWPTNAACREGKLQAGVEFSGAADRAR